MEVECDCEYWKRGLRRLNIAIRYAWNHGHTYEGVDFKFCPWCGKKLEEVKTNGS